MKNLFQIKFFLGLFVFPLLIVGLIGCSSDDGDSDNNPTGPSGNHEYLLIIENGAQIINPDEAFTYSAILVNELGEVSRPNSVQWTTSNSDLCTIDVNGAVSVVNQGFVTITARTTVNSTEYTATAPLKITLPEVFAVVPGAVMIIPGETIELTPVFFTEGSVNYSWASSNTGVATVNGQGVLAGVAAGTAEITCTATNKDNAAVIIPVLVIGMPQVELPVTQVRIAPPAAELFRGDQQQFSGTAYTSDGSVAGETITWSSVDPTIMSIDANGLGIAHEIGETTIRATAKGVIGQALVTVYPDTVVFITPIMADVTPGETFQFTARAYNVRNQPMLHLPSITSFNWYMPTWSDFGPEFEIFDIGTLNQTGLLTVKPDALIGMSTIVLACVPGQLETTGAAMVTVGLDFPWP